MSKLSFLSASESLGDLTRKTSLSIAESLYKSAGALAAPEKMSKSRFIRSLIVLFLNNELSEGYRACKIGREFFLSTLAPIETAPLEARNYIKTGKFIAITVYESLVIEYIKEFQSVFSNLCRTPTKLKQTEIINLLLNAFVKLKQALEHADSFTVGELTHIAMFFPDKSDICVKINDILLKRRALESEAVSNGQL